MTPRTRRCNEATIAGRLRKAEQFLDAAETIREFADDEHETGDAFVTLCVHAGIAAADVLCCIALGEHAQGENHNDALDRSVGRDRTVRISRTRCGRCSE